MTDLNLNDPKMLQAVLAASTTEVPNFLTDEQVAAAAVNEKLKPADALKAKVAAAQKSATYTLKLNGEQLSRIQRSAIESGFGEDWQSYLTAEIHNKIFTAAVGAPKISRPSWADQKVAAPTYFAGR